MVYRVYVEKKPDFARIFLTDQFNKYESNTLGRA